MIPGRPLVLLGIAPLVMALLTLFDRSLIVPMLAADLGIVLLAAFDALLARRPLIGVRRTAPEVLSIGRPNPVLLELRSRSARRLEVTVTDDLFFGAQSADLPLSVTLAARGRAELRYRVLPDRRGAYQLGDHHLRYRSPLGLWIRQLNISARTAVRVYPDVQAVRTYELLARQNREHELFRSSRLRGGESEFERLRDYRREDEFRTIDWKATARRRKLTAREYQLERNQAVVFALDAGRLMTAQSGDLSLFDHALNATLMLSHVAARGGDRVGLVAFADEVKRYLPPTAGRRASGHIIQAGYDLHPALVETDYRVVSDALGLRLRQRALLVFFTQVVDEVAAAELGRLMVGLLPRHLPLVVLLRDVELEQILAPAPASTRGGGGGAARGGAPNEWYVRGAAAARSSRRDRVKQELARRGALVLDVRPGQLTPALINRYLEIKARHLL